MPLNPITRGDVIEVNLDPTVGTEIKKTRRCVVVQNNTGNRHSQRTIIVPASADERPLAKHFPVWVSVKANEGGFTKDAVIMCDQIRAVDKQRIVRTCGRLSPVVMDRVDAALRISLGLR